jgi:DNA-binding NarL/FixJ family response regulator
MKDTPIEAVLAGMRKILSGHIALSDVMASQMLQNAATPRSASSPMEQLSTRELQVYEMLGRGLNNKSIADGLGVSHKTIGTYKARLMEKLGCRTTPELMLLARQSEFQPINPISPTH